MAQVNELNYYTFPLEEAVVQDFCVGHLHCKLSPRIGCAFSIPYNFVPHKQFEDVLETSNV